MMITSTSMNSPDVERNVVEPELERSLVVSAQGPVPGEIKFGDQPRQARVAAEADDQIEVEFSVGPQLRGHELVEAERAVRHVGEGQLVAGTNGVLEID